MGARGCKSPGPPDSVVLHTFLFDEYDAYGEIPIPGTGALHLPKGEVTITFHTRVAVAGGHPNPGLAIPDLSMTIDPPRASRSLR